MKVVMSFDLGYPEPYRMEYRWDMVLGNTECEVWCILYTPDLANIIDGVRAHVLNPVVLSHYHDTQTDWSMSESFKLWATNHYKLNYAGKRTLVQHPFELATGRVGYEQF